MVREYQITLVCKSGAYKPVSCIVKSNTEDLQKMGKEAYTKDIKTKGITKICQKRYWQSADLKRYGYTSVKVREYNKEKIEAENIARYEAIKQEKYACGEWKAPKKRR